MRLADMVEAELSQQRRSRRWLARELGVAPQTINNLVNGYRPDVTTLCKLSHFLGEPVGFLLQLAGLAAAVDLGQGQIAAAPANDWPTLKVLRIMRGLSYRRRKRLLQVVELWLEDRSGEVGRSTAP